MQACVCVCVCLCVCLCVCARVCLQSATRRIYINLPVGCVSNTQLYLCVCFQGSWASLACRKWCWHKMASPYQLYPLIYRYLIPESLSHFSFHLCHFPWYTMVSTYQLYPAVYNYLYLCLFHPFLFTRVVLFNTKWYWHSCLIPKSLLPFCFRICNSLSRVYFHTHGSFHTHCFTHMGLSSHI